MSATLSDKYPWSKMKYMCQLSKSDKYPFSKIWSELYLSVTFRNKYPLPRIWNEIYVLDTLETNTSYQKWIIKLFNRWDCLIYHLSVRVLSDGRLLLHALLCFSCDVCVNQTNYEECSNHSKVGLSRIHSMERQINHNTDQWDEQSEEAPVTPLMSLVSVGSVVAVFTDDSDFDYYLLLVKKNIFTLSKDSTDSWG